MNILIKTIQARKKSSVGSIWSAFFAPVIADLLRLPEILPDPEGRLG